MGPEDVRRYRERMLEPMMDPAARDRIRALLDEMIYPAQRPAHGAIQVDGVGTSGSTTTENSGDRPAGWSSKARAGSSAS